MKFYIARDDDKSLHLYTNKPYLEQTLNKRSIKRYFMWDNGKCYELDNELFPEITVENSPQEIEINFL